MKSIQQRQLEQLLKELDSLHSGTLANWSEQEKEDIKNKLTYHSNKIEGLQLTYGDTISFLKDKLIKVGAMAKDISDLKNYKAILNKIFSTYDSVALTESTIKDLHAELMQDPSQWDVIDALQAGPGEYKIENNYVFRSGGEHVYLDHSLVPSAMKDFIIELNAEMASKVKHPIVIIAESHFNFLQIHPFTDGNGRMARLISTLLLLKLNFPPLVIEATEKEKYFKALVESESEGCNPIAIFFAEKMILSLKESRGL
ncbi:MAG TPA: Fic family protein [Cyclobacteriaceae bacterium]|nr:Fic family protein [Cyclobacteriaceae bacterium]